MIGYIRATVQQSWFWFIVSGIGTGVGILWPSLWWLVFPGIAAFFYAVEIARSWTIAWWGGWLAGTIKIGCALGWIFTTYPIEWIDLGLGQYELPVIGFYWLTLAAVVGAASAVLAGMLYGLRKYLAPVWWSFCGAVLWVVTETLGAFNFSLFTLGDGGTLNAYFSFGAVGNLLTEHTLLLQFARVGGVYALSVIAVMIGVLLYCQRGYLGSRHRLPVAAAAVFILIGTAAVALPGQPSGLPGTVAIIDTRFGGSDYFSREDKDAIKTEALREAVAAAKARGAAYIILPEGVSLLPEGVPTAQAFIQYQNLYSSTDTVFIESARVPVSTETVALRGRIYDERSRLSYTVDKQRLVPQGEFMPTFYLTILNALGLDEAIVTINKKLDYRPGPYASQAKLPTHVPGILFCFAEADPLSVRRFMSERAVPFIVQPISHAWFHEPESLWWQYDAMRKVHAVWNHVSIVSVGNMATGAWYTSQGEKIVPEEAARGEWWTLRIIP